MTRAQYMFTSESVSEGHPDKVCDRISDEILDAHLRKAPEARVAVETMVVPNKVIIAGETSAVMPEEALEEIVRAAVRDVGYEQEDFHWAHMAVEQYIQKQSEDIAQGVDEGGNKPEGAGDQGIMFGYACDETSVFMPAPIVHAHRILEHLAQVRRRGDISGIGPDSKSQVTLVYENHAPVRAHSVVVSTQHEAQMRNGEVHEIAGRSIRAALPEAWMCDETILHINPTGRFVKGGPAADAGLTGRKIIVDTYGGAAPHGGGAFSGKDPTKVDRSAAYAARYLAKNVVAAGLARRCTLQLAYAIGVAEPLALYVNLHGTGEVCEEKLERILPDVMDLTPKGIRQHLRLNAPIYARTAAYGHFGRQPDDEGGFSWEKTDLADKLKSAFSG